MKRLNFNANFHLTIVFSEFHNPETMSCQILSKEERSLMQAVHEGDVKTATMLITEDKVAVNIQDCLMRTPLIRTCYLLSRDTRCTLAKLLLKNGANVNTTDKHGRTALMTACMETDREDLVKIMLNAKTVEVNARDERGNTALMHAVRTDNVESVRCLVTWKPPSVSSGKVTVDLGDFEGMYPLLLAAKQQNPDICEILVRDGEAPYSDIPNQWKKYLPPECRNGKRRPITNDPFEKYRHQAQDILNTPFRPPMILNIDPESLSDIEEEPIPEKKEETNQEAKETKNTSEKSDHLYPWMSAMAVTRYKKKVNDNDNKNQNNSDAVEQSKEEEKPIEAVDASDVHVEVEKKPETPSQKDRPKSRESANGKDQQSTKDKYDKEEEKDEKQGKREDEKDKDKDKEEEEKDKKEEVKDKRTDEKDKKEDEKVKKEEEKDKKADEKEKKADEKDETEDKDKQEQQKAKKEDEKDTKEEEKDKKEDIKDDEPKKQNAPENKAESKTEEKDKDKPKDEPFKEEKDKSTGQRVDEPEKKDKGEHPPMPAPAPKKPKKKKGGAYKTKTGRVIHPNAHKDPMYEKIQAAKSGGKPSASGNNGKPSGTNKPAANKRPGQRR